MVEKPLPEHAAERFQTFGLLRRLDPFRHDPHPEFCGDVDERIDDDGAWRYRRQACSRSTCRS